MSKKGNRITPANKAGPKWNGVNGKVSQVLLSVIFAISESSW